MSELSTTERHCTHGRLMCTLRLSLARCATRGIYGQVKKCYRRRKLVRVMHVMRLGTQADLMVGLQGLGFSGRLNTTFIERVNLTVRQGVASLARRTWATAQQSMYLLASLEWWRAYYHFVSPHKALRVALVQPQQRGGQPLGTTLPAADARHGSRQNHPTMAVARGALVSFVADLHLRGAKARKGWSVRSRGVW